MKAPLTPQQALDAFGKLLDLSPGTSYLEYRRSVQELAGLCLRLGIHGDDQHPLPENPTQDERLIRFAHATGGLMADAADWNADTLDAIASCAYNLGLAGNDGADRFKWRATPPEPETRTAIALAEAEL